MATQWMIFKHYAFFMNEIVQNVCPSGIYWCCHHCRRGRRHRLCAATGNTNAKALYLQPTDGAQCLQVSSTFSLSPLNAQSHPFGLPLLVLFV